MIRDHLRAARPKQWIKNLLVFAAPGALGILDQGAVLADAALVFAGFCLTASGLYYWNDLRDRSSDRAHPRKRLRPIASGSIAPHVAAGTGSALVALGIALAAAADLRAAGVLGAYAALTLGYSMGLKRAPLLELMIVASGFVLRAVAGAVATDTDMSQWFLLCTMFGSLFVVAGKRYSEVLEFGEGAVSVRPTHEFYGRTFLQLLLVVACTVTLVAYVLWAFEGARSSTFSVPLYELSIAPMLLAVLRYLQLLESGKGGSPEDIFVGDRAIEAYSLVWLVVYGAAVYGR